MGKQKGKHGVTVTIEELGRRGDGIAEQKERKIYVPLTVKGDVVEVEPSGKKHVLKSIVNRSPHRVDPTCSHFGTCGGCLLQHVEKTYYAAWKKEIVASSLAYEGVSGVRVEDTHVVPENDRRRAEVRIVKTAGKVVLGFNARADKTVIDIRECAVLVPEIVAIFAPLRTLFSHILSRKEQVRALITAADNGLDINITASDEPEFRHLPMLADFAETNDLARLSWNRERLAERRLPIVRFGPVDGRLVPGAFLQASRAGQAFLIEQVSAALQDDQKRYPNFVADLFAGVGTFGLSLLEHCKVHAVEGDDRMTRGITDSVRGVKNLRSITSEKRDLFQRPLLVSELKKYNAVVFDPPRAGAREQSLELAKSNVPLIVAVSCNPESFARDAASLIEGGYELEWIKPLDQFLYSPHVELVARFTKNKRK